MNINTPSPKLLDQVRDLIWAKHYSIRTENQYLQWIRRFILFHGKRHPRDMGGTGGIRIAEDSCPILGLEQPPIVKKQIHPTIHPFEPVHWYGVVFRVLYSLGSPPVLLPSKHRLA